MASLSERIYQHSPVIVQQALVAIYGTWWYHRRFGNHFNEVCAELTSHQSWTREQFDSYQAARLQAVIDAAWKSPYYAAVFAAAGIKPGPFARSDLARLPLLSKETLRSAPTDQLTERRIPRDITVFHSSGSTGTPTDIYYTPRFHAWEMAVTEVYNLGWAGVNHHSRRVMFGARKVCRYDQSKPPFWRYSPAENMAYASIYHLSAHFLPDYAAFLKAYQPDILTGYPSSLYIIARYLLDHKITLPPVKAIFTSAETLQPELRQVIETAFSARVFDHYGSVENCAYVAQCEFGRYHVIPEVGIIEILDHDGQPCSPGVTGEMVCTGLQNTLQPLIRYRVGDLARWAEDQTCRCGRPLAILESIDGRMEDLCITLDGREVLRFDTVFKGVSGVKTAQVIQNQLDDFTIRVVTDANYTSVSANQLGTNLRLHVGDVAVQVETVDEIPRSPNGKFRAVICNLTAEEKARARQRVME